MPISDIFPGSSLVITDTRSSPSVPLPIRLGDANLDGFPDLLFVTASTHGGVLGIGSATNRTPRLLRSMPCSKGVSGCDKSGHGPVGWQPVKKNVDALDSIVDASRAMFIDIDEDVSPLNISMMRIPYMASPPHTTRVH